MTIREKLSKKNNKELAEFMAEVTDCLGCPPPRYDEGFDCISTEVDCATCWKTFFDEDAGK